MRHSVFGKKLSRSPNERKSLRRNLMKSMIIHGKIKTSKTKAIAIRGELEHLITKAKKGTEAMRRDILTTIGDRKVVDQLMEMAKTQFTARNSGYTRMIKIGLQKGDSTQLVLLSFVDEKVEAEVVSKPETKKKEDKKVEPAKEAAVSKVEATEETKKETKAAKPKKAASKK